jgi:hypothetical protein
MTLCSRNRVLVRAPVKGSLAFLQPGGAETSFTVIASKKQVRTGGARHAMVIRAGIGGCCSHDG